LIKKIKNKTSLSEFTRENENIPSSIRPTCGGIIGKLAREHIK